MDFIFSILVTFFTSPLFVVGGSMVGIWLLVRFLRFWRTGK